MRRRTEAAADQRSAGIPSRPTPRPRLTDADAGTGVIRVFSGANADGCAGRLRGHPAGPTGARLAARVLRSGAGFVYQRVLMERNCCREFRSPPALVLCLEASSTLVDLINVAIHEAPCVCGPVKRHRQHFVSQPIAVIVENSLYDVDHAPPHREGVASGVAQASVDVVVRPSSTASKAPRHSTSALSRTHASWANHSCSVRQKGQCERPKNTGMAPKRAGSGDRERT
jgi:hypothetical protein